jgi:biotin transport system ATP-binding protein
VSALRLDGVVVRAGSRTVLHRLDLELAERRVGLVGANGSGKSTLARLLNGLVLPDEGSVTVDGLSTERDGAAVRRRVGFVFTDPSAQLVMATPAEDVALSLRRHRLPRAEREARTSAVLERFGLAAMAHESAHALSAGQRQLLALAGVLVTEPEVLVADEPTTLLDLRNTLVVADLLARLPQQVVLATHDLSLLRGFDRVVVLDGGRVVADDAPAAAVAAYRALMGAQP